MKISGIVISKNEETKIGECLESLSFTNEILLIDNGSLDSTVEIANKLGARVIKVEGGYYSDLRNRGAKEAQGDWIFYLDSDERVTPLLRKEIQSLVTSHQSPYVAYAIPRRNFVLGKELKHGGLWPDYVKRLFLKRELGGWTGELHEEPLFSGNLGHLKYPLIHFKHQKLEEMVDKTNSWSNIEARLMYEAKHPPMNILRFISGMGREFYLRMLRQKAYLDGSIGIIYALYQVYSRFISYAKLWEMQINSSKFKVKNSKFYN